MFQRNHLLAGAAGLLCWLGGAARADFVAYNFFGLDGVSGTMTNVTRWGVSSRLFLPAPLAVETFDGGAETLVSSVAGWSETNRTDRVTSGLNPANPNSDTYLGWALITYSRLTNVFGSRRMQVAPGYEVNGQPVTRLLSNNLLYAESDQRSGNQVQVLFSPTYNFTGRTGITLVFNSAYEQNQDNIAGVEYSINGGASWLPLLYMVDQDDLVRDGAGNIDAVTTLTTAREDQPYGLAYSAWLGAPVTAALAPFLSGRVNDDPVESKRVEVFRLPAADNQANVRFRLFQAGTASWYWGIDDWQLYSVPYTDVSTGTLLNVTNGQPTGVTMTFSVKGRPLTARAPTSSVPPGPETGNAAFDAFPIDLGPAGATTLYAGETNFLDFTGLDPLKNYEIVLYSDRGTGDRSTGNLLTYTLSGADHFVNGSAPAPPLSVISGAQNQSVTIDVTDNGRGDRGYVCRFLEVRPGSDGAVRITLTTAEGACLNALKLVETTPERIALTGFPSITETAVVVTGVQGMETASAVYLCYGGADGGSDTNNWEHVIALGNLSPGQFTVQLTGLTTFKKYFVTFYSAGPAITAWSRVLEVRPQLQGLLYATGFEPGEVNAYLPGNLAGQGPLGLWSVSKGSATVQQSTSAHGLQAVQAGNCTINASLLATQQVLWVDTFFLESGLTNAPIVPTNAASSLIYFSATDGILALDGNGSGGGNFVQVVPTFPTNLFVRVTVRSDYASRRYDVWIDGVQQRTNLGFKDASVTRFSGVVRRAVATSYMDDFSVSLWGLDADSDGDGLVDLDEAKFWGSYPLLADSDGDGASDAHELQARTDPGDPESVFALQLTVDAQKNARIKVPTVTGLQYSLQRRMALGAGNWENVSNATNFPGDGSVKEFLQTSDGQNYFYRGVIINH
ncbi:MAG TPA: hypothetical protein PKN95_12890 [Verrucomicrobiota bacterium]|nr:hypothetical protein [Verrucomicrobiota bacterium]HNT16117.1 hypothetical protein [Verrucomicrobiota bacterium]